MKALLVTLTAALAAPASAFAAAPTMTVREVPLHAHRALAVAAPRFDMVAVHWRGSGSVLYRARSTSGRWSAWAPMDDDMHPNAGSAENRVRSWRLGNIVWTGPSTAIRFRTRGDVARLRAYYVWSAPERVPMRRLSIAGSPPIIPRLSWGADESIRRAPPQYADALRFAVVHHTAGSNEYSPAQSAAIVRGIELYHVEGNGWNDIGYNFLVDKYGQVFEGRYGGVDKPVIGAHSLGFNVGSVGIAVIGDYNAGGISAAARRSLEQLLAWRLDVAHVDPLSTLSVASGGNPRFPAGVPVFLRAISGHRDTNFTDCPGDVLYAQLPQIAKDVAALGLPKLYAPVVAGKLGGLVRFTGRLSSALPWTVTVVDSTGAQVAQGSGTGAAVDFTWDATLAPPDTYTWTIASPNVRPATGTIGAGPVALAIQKAAAAPMQLAPGETTTISYTLTAPATVTVTLLDANGLTLSTLYTEAKPAGAQSFAFTAEPGLANGDYTIALSAAAVSGRTATAAIPLAVDDILTGFAETPPVFSAALHQSAALTFTLARAPTSATFSVSSGTTVVASPPVQLAAGPQTLTWDGANAPDGTYTLSLQIVDGTTTFTRTATVTLDSTPPTITPLSYRNLRFRISEPTLLTLIVGAARYSRTLKQPATTQFWLRTRPRVYTLVATDAAGNRSSLRYPPR
jgi:flagellar hook assembly protein FlgD